MAFKMYTGLQMQGPDLEPPNSNTVVPIIPTGGVRVMGFGGNGWPVSRIAAMVQRLKDPSQVLDGIPKFVVLMIHGSPWGGSLYPTPAAYAARCSALATACDADAFEIGNEPAFGVNGTAGNVNGVYFNYLIAGADAIKAAKPNVPRVLAAPYSSAGSNPFYSNAQQTFTNKGLDIHDYIEGFAIHPYSVQGTPTDTLGKMQSARTLVDSGGFASGQTSGSWSDLPMYCTEVGWTQKAPRRPQDALPAGDELGSVAPGTVSGNVKQFFSLMATNRTALKLRFAGYFVGRDYSSQGDIGAAFMGIMKDPAWSESLNSPGVNVKYGVPSGGPYNANSPLPLRPSYTVLRDQVPIGYDLGTATPPACTTTAINPANVTQTTAGLQGTVNPNGQATTRYFQWGQTVAYGNTSTGVSVGSGSTPVNVGTVINVMPNTTYHFRCFAGNIGGQDFGVDRTFTSDAVVSVPPVVVTGPPTNVTPTGATLNGTVNPSGQPVSDYHFEYGTTVAYGTSIPVPAGTLASGSADVSVSAPLSGLTAGQTVHYRLVATNASGTTNGADQVFIVTTPPTGTRADLSTLAVLSTLLAVEVTTADGRSFRWDVDDAEPTNRPLAAAFSTQAGDGFAEASCQLPRSIAFDWPDLHILDRLRFIGSDGSIAYEGRVVATPRRVGDEGEVIEVQAQGLMASARDRTFTQIIVDRSGDRWQPPSLALRKAIYAVGTPLDADWTASADSGSLMFKGGTLKRMSAGSQAALEYIAPTGQKLAAFQYTGDQKQFNANDDTTAELHATDDDSAEMGTWDKVSLTLDGTGIIQTAALTTARRYLGLRARTVTVHGSGSDPGGAPTSPALRRYDKIAVYGNHGIEPRPNGEDPDGVYASDVVTWLIERYCPLLNADNVEQTQTPIAHLVFDTPTQPFDAMSLVNGFHLWQLGAWEGGAVTYAPVDFRNIDWQIRTDDPGVSLDLQGDSVDSFANGIVVSYTDVSERQVNLFPDVQGELRDDDPDNPANRQGIQLWTSIEVSNPMDLRGALALGRVALREFNRPKAPGSITVNLGYIEDGQGNLQPGWKVRAGDTLGITDLPNDEPRLISATSWTEDGSLQITLEQPPTRIDAVLARFELDAQVYRKTRRPALGRSNG